MNLGSGEPSYGGSYTFRIASQKEIDRKIGEYFAAGVQLVWIVDPAARSVDVYKGPDECTRLNERQTHKGGTLLPGFALLLRKLFARAEGRRGR